MASLQRLPNQLVALVGYASVMHPQPSGALLRPCPQPATGNGTPWPQHQGR